MPGAGLAFEFADQGLVRFATRGQFHAASLLFLTFLFFARPLLVDGLPACGDRTKVGEDAWNQ